MLASFLTIAISSFISSVPFLLLGCIASGILAVYFPAEEISRLIPERSFVPVLTGALAGLFFPVGDAGVLPLARRFISKGAPVSFGIAFLLAAPSINLIAMAGTYAAFGPGVVFWGRLGITLLIAIGAGWMFSLEKVKARVFCAPPEAQGETVSQAADPQALTAQLDTGGKFTRLVSISVDEFFEFGALLVAGILVSAAIRAFAPGLLAPLAAVPPLALCGRMAGLSFLSSSSSMEIAFTALGFAGSVPVGGQLVFLVLGSMFNLKGILMLFKTLRPRVILITALFAVLIILIMGVSAVYLLG